MVFKRKSVVIVLLGFLFIYLSISIWIWNSRPLQQTFETWVLARRNSSQPQNNPTPPNVLQIPEKTEYATNNPHNNNDHKSTRNPPPNSVAVLATTTPEEVKDDNNNNNPIYIVADRGIVWMVEGMPVPNCEVNCYFKRTADESIKAKADGIIYSDIDTARGGRPEIVKMFFSSESDANYPFQTNLYRELGSVFDMSVSYHQPDDSVFDFANQQGRSYMHLPLSYSTHLLPEYYKDPVPFKEKKQDAVACVFISNCGAGHRLEILRELMNALPIDSFGGCMNNGDVVSKTGCQPLDPPGGNQFRQKVCAMRKYKFYLAFENSFDASYATEKFWQSLATGTVGIYLGAPNIEKFLPSTEDPVIINLSQMKNLTAVIELVKELSQNEEKYNRYFAWKKKTPLPSFKRLVDNSLDFPGAPCQMCKNVKLMKKKKLEQLAAANTKAPSAIERKWTQRLMTLLNKEPGQDEVGKAISDSFKQLLQERCSNGKWIFEMSAKYQSIPYLEINPDNEPPPPEPLKDDRFKLPPAIVDREITRVCNILKSRGEAPLCEMFQKTFPNTLQTATTLLDDNTTYIITGDIDLMWLRDSSAEVIHYLPLTKEDATIRRVIEGLIRRQAIFIHANPYGASFRTKLRPGDDLGDFHISRARNLYSAMHDYELDSLCYFLVLSYKYWRASGSSAAFDETWRSAVELVLFLIVTEQYHSKFSPYHYVNLHESDVVYTGMSWSGYRPSDDPCQYGYLIPSNMFAVVALKGLEEIFNEVFQDTLSAEVATIIKDRIQAGISKFGITTKGNSKIYAYEVDGRGNVNCMDDANVPSLLSMPYWGYTNPSDPKGEIMEATRKFVLSSSNPYYYQGKYAKGIGSPHTPSGSIWPMSLIMQALTTSDTQEIKDIIKMLQDTHAGTQVMHESFNPNEPTSFTRPWFVWANSLFAELIWKYSS